MIILIEDILVGHFRLLPTVKLEATILDYLITSWDLEHKCFWNKDKLLESSI